MLAWIVLEEIEIDRNIDTKWMNQPVTFREFKCILIFNHKVVFKKIKFSFSHFFVVPQKDL